MIVGQDDVESTRRALEAATILIRCKDDRRLSRQERESIVEWMRQSRENVACLFDMFDVAQKLDRLKLRNRMGELSTPEPRPPGFALSRPAVLWSSAAVMALCAGLSFFSIRDGEAPIRHMTLDDGSVMHRLRGCEFNIEFSDRQRLITLQQCEAVFEVAKDPRPFVVRSLTSDAIAVGTRFGVAATASGTTVVVSEGKVSVVAPPGADPATGTPLHAGQEFRVLAGASQPQPVLAVDAESRISWAAGWIAFEGETAGQAVRAFNRFSEVHVEITQPELSSMRVKYGRFEVDKPESFADNLANVLGASVTSKRNVIYIGEPRKPE